MADKGDKRHRASSVNSDINVTPMVDVMLVLLIIFMVITPMLQKGVNVELAKTNNLFALVVVVFVVVVLIAVERDGKVYFDTEQISPDQLTAKVADKLQNRADKKVFIKADARARYK